MQKYSVLVLKKYYPKVSLSRDKQAVVSKQGEHLFVPSVNLRFIVLKILNELIIKKYKQILRIIFSWLVLILYSQKNLQRKNLFFQKERTVIYNYSNALIVSGIKNGL